MLQRKPNTLQICWPEASLLVNYEADTLPLLFSSDEDFILYFNTLMELHNRKARLIEQVRKCNTLARQDKENGEYISCVQRLAEACEIRCKMFAAGDYQITSAVEHSIWSQIHLGTLLLTQGSLSDAHHLFTAAADRIKGVRPKSSAKSLPLVNGGNVVILSKKTCDRLNLVLHNNWSNYWARRGKWHATLQHASKAQHLWGLVSSSGGGTTLNLTTPKDSSDEKDTKKKQDLLVDQALCTSYVTSFLACRVNAALCGTWEEPNLNLALKNTSSKSSSSSGTSENDERIAHLFYSASGVPTSTLLSQTEYDRNEVASVGDEETDQEVHEGPKKADASAPPPPLVPLDQSSSKPEEGPASKTENTFKEGGSNHGNKNNNAPPTSSIPLDHLATKVPGVTFRLVTIDIQDSPGSGEDNGVPFSLTLCLDSATPEFCTTWPAHVTALFIETYSSAFAAMGVRKYGRVESCLQACASIASKCEADCNPIWWKRVQAMYLLLQDAPGVDKASGFRMTRKDMIQKDVISAAKLVRDFVERDRRAMTPSVGNGVASRKSLASRASTPNAVAEKAPSTSLRHRTPTPTTNATSGVDDTERSTSDWGQMTSLFKQKVKPADALKQIGNVERDIATPIQLVRRGGPRTIPSLDHRGRQEHHDQRPATVSGMLGEFSTVVAGSEQQPRYRLDEDAGVRRLRPNTSSEAGTFGPSMGEITPPSSPLAPIVKSTSPGNIGTKKFKHASRAEQEMILNSALEDFRYEESKSVSRVRRQLDAALQEEREREAHLEVCYENLKIALGNCRERRETLEAARERRIELASPVRARNRGGETEVDVTSNTDVPDQEVSLVDIIDHERAVEAAEQARQDEILEQRKNARAIYKNNMKRVKKQAESRRSVDRKRSVAFGTSLIPDPETGKAKPNSRSASFISGAFDAQSEVGSESSSAHHGSPDQRDRSASAVSNNSQSPLVKSFKSGYKLNVEVDAAAEAADADSKFERSYSTKRKKSVMVTDFDTGVVSAKKQYDYVPEVDTITEKQKRLRSLLPAMDHRTETYRMVMKELAENEQILKLRRSEFKRQKLERNAEKVAKKAGMVSVWRKLVEKKAVERRATLLGMKDNIRDKPGPSENYDSWSDEEISAAALLARLALSPSVAIEAKVPPTETI